MNKKKQNKKTSNPRRGNGRVYQMEETTLPKAILDSATGHILGLPIAKVVSPQTLTPQALDAAVASASVRIPTEDICSKARRLANEAEEIKKKERAERELAFMKKMFETEDLAGAGVVMDKVREDGTIEYLICGRRWVYGETLYDLDDKGNADYHGYLLNIDDYLDYSLCHNMSGKVCDITGFGQLLKHMEKREAELRAKYPDNWWGRLKAHWA